MGHTRLIAWLQDVTPVGCTFDFVQGFKEPSALQFSPQLLASGDANAIQKAISTDGSWTILFCRYLIRSPFYV